MTKYLLCLANSKKYTNRCLAGIELSRNDNGFVAVKRGDEPVWMRPVSNHEHGEIEAALVKNVKLLDILELQTTAHRPFGYQSENVRFIKKSLKIIRPMRAPAHAISKLTTVRPQHLFGTIERRIHVDQISAVDHSLLLIKPETVNFIKKSIIIARNQIRSQFRYRGVGYDLPVTCLEFEPRFWRDKDFWRGFSNIHLAVSLGMAFNNAHYKLVAGVILL